MRNRRRLDDVGDMINILVTERNQTLAEKENEINYYRRKYEESQSELQSTKRQLNSIQNQIYNMRNQVYNSNQYQYYQGVHASSLLNKSLLKLRPLIQLVLYHNVLVLVPIDP